MGAIIRKMRKLNPIWPFILADVNPITKATVPAMILSTPITPPDGTALPCRCVMLLLPMMLPSVMNANPNMINTITLVIICSNSLISTYADSMALYM